MDGIESFLGGLAPEILALRMGLVALFVVVVALVAERLGPFLGAMVASLPLYTGPVYLMLALEKDAAYLEAATVASVAICGANPVLVMIYAILAKRQSLAVALGSGLVCWGLCAIYVQSQSWSLGAALLFVTPIYLVSLVLAQNFTRGIAIRRAERRWSDLVIRAVLVALLTGAVMVASRHVPAEVTGVLSVLPALTSSLVLVMHPRVGGPATAALLAHTLGGLVGMVVAFAIVHLAIPEIGVWPALAVGLAITIGWNMALVIGRLLSAKG